MTMMSRGVPVKYVLSGFAVMFLFLVIVLSSSQDSKASVTAPEAGIESLTQKANPAAAVATFASPIVPQQNPPQTSAPSPVVTRAASSPASAIASPPAGNGADEDASSTLLDSVYHKYFQQAILEEMGSYIAGALYDPSILIQIMKTPNYMAHVNTGDSHGMPSSLVHAYEQLVDIKRATSAGLGRMHRDVSMSDLYNSVTPAELIHFDRSVRHFIRGQVRQALLKIQSLIDFGPTHDHLAPLFQKRLELFEGHDPAWAFLNGIGATTSAVDIKSAWLNLGKEGKPSLHNPAHLHPAEQLFHLEYNRPKYGHQQPHKQKYMYLWRPTASCFEIQRECEFTDGCRYYCNFAYLQSAQEPSLVDKPFHHRLLGFGSNNEYDWELSMVKYFGYDKVAVHNKMYSMTSFDCTLSVWKPPTELKSLPLGWGGASFCVGDKTGTQAAPNFGHYNRNQRNVNFVAFSEMKQRILESEHPGQHATVLRNDMQNGAPIPVNTKLFDEVSILKCDIEGSEMAVMYTWSNGELASFNNNKDLQAKISVSEKDGDFLMVDFSKIIPEYFTVSTVLMEIHGWGPSPMDAVGAFRTQHLLQQLTQMGYVMVSMEKNFNGDLAYEVVFVHYRYFVRSEIWSHLKGRKSLERKSN